MEEGFVIRNVLFASLFSACIILLGCSRNLDRSTAERLIREAGEVPGSSVEFGIQSPAFLDSTPGRWPPLHRPTDATRLNVAFVDKLVGAGVLAWQEPRTYPSGNGGLYGTETDRPFTAIPQEFVERSDINPDYVTLVLARPELRSVTGITQEEDGVYAQATAEIGLKPTPLYERLLPVVSDMLNACQSLRTSCSYWPTPEKFTQTRTATFSFRKYDDGWRLEQR